MQSNYCLVSTAPSADSYVFETGEVQQLLNLGGTIPIVYQQETYNIPVKVCTHNQHWPHSPVLCRCGCCGTTPPPRPTATSCPPRTWSSRCPPTSTTQVSLELTRAVELSRANSSPLVQGWWSFPARRSGTTAAQTSTPSCRSPGIEPTRAMYLV